jgi:plastocyanin
MTLALALMATACGSSSSQPIATRSPASTPSAVESVAPALNVTSTVEDYTGKPPPAGAVVMTMANFMFTPSVPAATGSKIVIYIDNKDPEKNDCADGSDICHVHALLVLGPKGDALGKTADVTPGHQAVLTLDGMRPGIFRFYCPVGFHKDAGMVGRLTIS